MDVLPDPEFPAAPSHQPLPIVETLASRPVRPIEWAGFAAGRVDQGARRPWR